MSLARSDPDLEVGARPLELRLVLEGGGKVVEVGSDSHHL